MSNYLTKRRRNKELARRHKADHPCVICGESRVACLDFHHFGDGKIDGIAVLVDSHVSVKRLRAEICKCVVVCANCHRIIHFGG